jgi:hypothetical protein
MKRVPVALLSQFGTRMRGYRRFALYRHLKNA